MDNTSHPNEKQLEAMLKLTAQRMGTTPQERFSWRQTCFSVVQPTRGYSGRNLESCRAVTPDFVTVIMALAPRSWAVVQVA